MSTDLMEAPPVEFPLGALEQAFIEEYVRGRGYDIHHLGDLSGSAREALLREASVYSSMRLTEVESRSQFVHDLHDVGPTVVNTGFR